MYHRQNKTIEKPIQTVDLFSLKKKNYETITSYQNNKFSLFGQHEGTILTFLGFYQFASNVLINENVFENINFQQISKNYQQYSHEKTMKVLLKFIIDRNQSQNSLIELINQYPIVIFVLEAYCRITCVNYIKNNKQILLFGNQIQILQDFSFEIRGNLLQIMANALGFQISITFGQTKQSYGQEKNQKKLSINYTENCISAELSSKKTAHLITSNKQIQNSATKTLKQFGSQQTQASQSVHASSGQNSSLLPQSMIAQSLRCQKCKLQKNRCHCVKNGLSSPYHTPKSGTKYERTPVQSGLNSNILNVNSQSKCSCNKIFCVCRR